MAATVSSAVIASRRDDASCAYGNAGHSLNAGDIAVSPSNGDPIQALLALIWSGQMDGMTLELPLFLLATFVGGVVVGLTVLDCNAFGLQPDTLVHYRLNPFQNFSQLQLTRIAWR
jgi:hypothetical protein